jgi:hypothetical protein
MKKLIGLCLNLSAALVGSAAFAATPSMNGSNVSAQPSIIDADDNSWTLVSGVVEKNLAPAGTTRNADLLLLLNDNIYQRNTSNKWYHWNGSSWPSTKDPRVVSANAARIGAGTATLVDTSLHVWTLGTNEFAYVDGARAAGNSNTIALLYYDDVVYSENTSHAWYSWNGKAWVTVPGDPTQTGGNASPNGTTITPGVGSLVDAGGNSWTLTADEYAFEGGYRAGNNSNIVLVLLYGNVIYTENSSGSWYAWNGTAWSAAHGDPRGPNLAQYATYTSAVCPASNPGCVPKFEGNSSVSFSKPTTKGNAIWVAATVSDYGGIHTITVTDSQHNTYYALNQENDSRPGAQTVAHFYAENVVGGADTITVNWAADNYKGIVAAEVAGVKASPLVGNSGRIQDGGMTNAADNVGTGAIAVPAAATSALVLSLTMDTNGGGSDIGGSGNCALPPGTGFTQVIQFWNWAPAGQAACNLATLETKTVAAAGNVAGTFTTVHPADPYLTVTAVFH